MKYLMLLSLLLLTGCNNYGVSPRDMVSAAKTCINNDGVKYFYIVNSNYIHVDCLNGAGFRYIPREDNKVPAL